jgi:broad specificity phosphatase PhoE
VPAIYLLRHGQADYRPIRRRGWPGATADLAPLSELGERQAGQAARRARQLAGTGQTWLVSSPVTRALQTAAIVAGHLGLSLTVEFELREWLPDSTFGWHTHAEVRAAVDDLERHGGEWPAGQQLRWEPLSQVRDRAAAALARSAAGLSDDAVLIAVCHEMVIRAITGEPTTGTGEFRLVPQSEGAA